jgi:hypothetical protein
MGFLVRYLGSPNKPFVNWREKYLFILITLCYSIEFLNIDAPPNLIY